MVILSTLFTIYFVFRTRGIQTIAVKLAADYVSKELKTDIRIGGFDISWEKGLVIEDVSVKDRNHQEIFAAQSIGISISKLNLRKKILDVRQVSINKGVLQLITYKGDSALNLKFILDYFASTDTSGRMDTTARIPWRLSVSSVELVETRFHLQDENEPERDTGMNFTNIDVNHINLLITDFFPEKDTLNARIRHLSAIERSGLCIRSMSGEFRVSPAFLKAENLLLVTNNSDLDLSFRFLYDQWSDYNDFLNKVKIVAQIRPSYLDLSDIGAFAPELYVMKDKFQFSGDIKGTVSNFHAKNFRFAFGSSTRFWGNISANGLPDVEETFIDLDIKELLTNKADIESVKIPGDLRSLALPGFIEKMGNTEITGTFTGFYNDFAANIKLNSAIGDGSTDLLLKKQENSNDITYKGGVNINNLQLGELLDDRHTFGGITLKADVNGKGFSLNDASLTMNVHIDSARLYQYDYHDIDIKGSLNDKKFTGHVDVKDLNLALFFNGIMDFSDSIPAFDFTSTIHNANLFKLKLLERDSILNLSAKIKADFTGSNLDNIDGMIKIDSAIYREGDKMITMDHLALFTSTDDQRKKSYQLTSDFVDATVSGDFNFSEILPSTVLFIENYLASFKLNDSLINIPPSRDQLLKYKITFKNSDEVTNIFLPILKIAPATVLEGSYDEKNYRINLDGRSPDLEISGAHLRNWYMKATTIRDNLSINTGCEQFFFGKPEKKDSAFILLDSLNLVSNMNHDTVHYNLSWTSQDNRSVVGGFLSFTNSPGIELGVSHFDVMIDHRFWKIADDNLIVFDSASIDIQNLVFSSNDELLKLEGRISRNTQDTIYASFDKVDISHLDYLIGSREVDIDGILSGDFKLVNPYGGFTILSDLSLDSLKFNKEMLGEATFKVVYDNMVNRFDLNSQIIYRGNTGTNIPLSISGSVFMNEKEPRLNFDVNLKNLNLVMVSPFVSSFMSGIHGLASGDIKVRGTTSYPLLTGQLKLMRTELKINYLNVAYSLADIVTIDTNAFRFKNITIFDSLGNKAYLNGNITHNHFKDFRLDLSINFDDFSAFRNSYSQNPVFYGNARASGNVEITGPVDDLNISVKAKTGSGTHVIIPIDLSSGVGQSDFIIFKDPLKDTIMMTRVPQRVTNKGLSLDLAVMVKPDADLEVFLPDQLGKIRASGSGNLSMSMTPASGFSLLGSYSIEKGSFLFALRNLMRLTFSISQGSKITWDGNPADATVEIHALYKTRVALEGVTADQSQAAKRIPVECIIHLGGKLLNPEISFSLNLPNVENNIKSEVYAAIDTNNQVELSQQVLYILLMNQFKPVAGGTSSALNMSSTPITLATNQLSSWLSGITQNVNVGVNYKAGTTTSGQEFDVAVSTQLLNDRLLIDGTFGMSYENPSSQQQASTIVGDINIEYVLTKNRRWRLKAFNRTNTTDNIIYNNAPYTQGVGISWQRGFNKIGDMFKKDKKKKL